LARFPLCAAPGILFLELGGRLISTHSGIWIVQTAQIPVEGMGYDASQLSMFHWSRCGDEPLPIHLALADRDGLFARFCGVGWWVCCHYVVDGPVRLANRLGAWFDGLPTGTIESTGVLDGGTGDAVVLKGAGRCRWIACALTAVKVGTFTHPVLPRSVSWECRQTCRCGNGVR
jgi:hypothetical protein